MNSRGTHEGGRTLYLVENAEPKGSWVPAHSSTQRSLNPRVIVYLVTDQAKSAAPLALPPPPHNKATAPTNELVLLPVSSKEHVDLFSLSKRTSAVLLTRVRGRGRTESTLAAVAMRPP